LKNYFFKKSIQMNDRKTINILCLSALQARGVVTRNAEYSEVIGWGYRVLEFGGSFSSSIFTKEQIENAVFQDSHWWWWVVVLPPVD
jgi:hypothetical protein